MTNKNLPTKEKKPRGHNLRGRPKGAVNKTTLFKQAMQEGFEKELQRDFKKVLRAVIDKAVKGDMQAAKMLMDRVIPTSKAIDLDDLTKSKGLTISINVGSLEDKANTITVEGEVVDDSYGED